MEYRYNINVAIITTGGTGDRMKGKLEDIVFPNPVVKGMSVTVTVPSKSGSQSLTGEAEKLRNMARHENGGFVTSFYLPIIANPDKFESLMRELRDNGFNYSRD